MKKRTKIVLFVLLGFLIAGLATFGAVSAYWVSTINNPGNRNEGIQITIGEGKPVNTEIDLAKSTVAAGVVLVPTGKKAVSDNHGGTKQIEEEIEINVTVKWIESGSNQIVESDQVAGTCLMKAIDIKIDGQTTDAALVDIKIESQDGTVGATKPIILNAASVSSFQVKVKLLEPSKEQYERIKDKNITFTLQTSVTKN